MNFRRQLFLLGIFSLFFISAFAQSSNLSASEQEKAKEELEKNAFRLVDEVISEANNLKLADNRAIVFALTGDLVWKNDEKQARKLFRDAANEIIQFYNTPKDLKKNNSPEELIMSFSENNSESFLRHSFIKIVAERDVDLALELLITTRPAELQAAINAQNLPKTPKEKGVEGLPSEGVVESYKVGEEIRLEQSLAVLAAEKDPKKAAKILRDSLSKGFSYQIFELLEKIHAKDKELAKELGIEVLQKLIDSDFNNERSSSFGKQVLQKHLKIGDKNANSGDKKGETSEKNVKSPKEEFRFEEKLIKEYAVKFADYLLKAEKSIQNYFAFLSYLPNLEKLVPEKAVLLRQKLAEQKKGMPAEISNLESVFNQDNSKASPDELIDNGIKADKNMRMFFYQNGIQKGFEQGGEEKARQLLQKIPSTDSEERSELENYIDIQAVKKKTESGKLEEAQKAILKLKSNDDKIRNLVALALVFKKKNTKEGDESAMALMSEANRLINEFPETYDETKEVIILASGYAVISPEKAFPMLENILNQSNELISAFVVLNKFNKRESRIRQSELVFNQNLQNLGDYILPYGEQLALLAKNDFGRTKSMTDIFQRADVRTLAKLFLAQSILTQKIGFGKHSDGFENGGMMVSNDSIFIS